jgi:tetratricopeptide (TPR) repeat protein
VRYLVMAQIYFQAGQYSFAIDTLNNSFSTHGDHSGWRFYLRAASYYELGDTEMALADLERGSEYAVLEDHLKAYVLGRIALDEGDVETGLAYLEDAQRTLSPAEFPQLFEKIDELFTLYGHQSDYQLPPVMLFADYPAYTDAEMALPRPPVGVESAVYVNYQGSGYIFPYGQEYVDFFSTYVFTHRRSTDLAEVLEADLVLQGYFLETGLQQGELGIDIYLYNFTTEKWDEVPGLAFGRVSLLDPEPYFSEEGFVYINIVPVAGQPRVVLSNVALEVLGRDSDGEFVFIGFGQE